MDRVHRGGPWTRVHVLYTSVVSLVTGYHYKISIKIGIDKVMSRGGGGGTRYIKKVGMLVKNFEIEPLRRPIWAWLAHFLTPKRD